MVYPRSRKLDIGPIYLSHWPNYGHNMEEAEPENEVEYESGEALMPPGSELEIDEEIINELQDSGPPTIWTNHENFEIYPASSVYGGLQPEGNFQMTFLLDSFADTGHKQELLGNSGLDPTQVGVRIRQRQTSVTITPSQALSIGSWIISHVTSGNQDEIMETISANFTITYGGKSEAIGPILKESDLSSEEQEKIEQLLTGGEGRAEFQETLKDAVLDFVKNWEGKDNE